MKTVVLSMISIAATIAAMTACTSESDPVDQIEAKVPIELNAGINNIAVKSNGVQTPELNDFDANIIASSTTKVYTSSIWTGTDPGKITVKSNDVTFSETQAYPPNGDEIFMKAYAPFNGIFNAGKVTFKIDGDQDIMISKEIKGSKTDKTSKILEFSHLLTQLNFTVAAQNEAAQRAWGKITAVKVKAITELDLTLSDGVLIGANLATEENIATIGFTEITSLPLIETPSKAGYVMVLPKVTAYEVIISSENGPQDRSITLTAPITTFASTAYNVLLTFTATDVEVSAKVGVWETGTGSGTVD